MENNTLLDTDLHENQWEFEYASTGQRFGNYLIDQIVLYGLSAIAGVVVGLVSPGVADDEMSLNIVGIVLALLVSVAYYTLLEGSNGKTLGKYLTRTRALTEDGERLDMNKAFLRSLCRLIPFEAFSFLGGVRGWHDTFSKTMVVKDR